ncbi:MAG: GNAT family N-acetyltransferase [Salibacteraceae bacterium]
MNPSVFESFPYLQTQRLKLGPLRGHPRHALDEVFSFQGASKTLLPTPAMLDKLERLYRERQAINWGLVRDGELVGTCGFYRGFNNQTGEIGYVMRQTYRRQGLLKEAAEAIVQFGFRELQLKCILAYTTEENRGSVKALEDLGFQLGQSDLEKYLKFECFPPKGSQQ